MKQLLILALLLTSASSLLAMNTTAGELLLSGNDIDLLVGAPTGIVEPLDNRRTRHLAQDSIDFSDYLDNDFDDGMEFSEFDWSDAEDGDVSESQTESALLDLLAETSELEDNNFTTDIDLNYTD